MKGKLAANLAMTVSKIGSGLNENALKFLLPAWMNAVAGVVFRVGFGAAAFWLVGLFMPKRDTTAMSWKMVGKVFLLGAVCIYGYMICLLEGLTYTTPVSSSLIICLEPVFVFILSMIFLSEKATWKKIFGMALGIGGALLCIFTQKESEIATRPLLGNMLCIGSGVLYSVYLVISKKMLAGIDMVSFNKWSFSGAACVACIVACFAPWQAKVLHQGIFSTPFLVLWFVLFVPSTISYFLVDYGLKKLSTTVVALYGYLILVVAMIVSYILGYDHFSWWQMVAVAMIVSSVYFVEIAESQKS